MWTIRAPVSGYSMERLVRPFVQATSKLPDPPKETPAIVLPGQDSEAFLSWGQESSFTIENPSNPAEDVNSDGYGSQVGFNTTSTGGVTGSQVAAGDKTAPATKRPQDARPGVTSLQEIDRQVETVTVYKPGDNTVWINVQRILSIRFRNLENGAILKMNLKPPAAPTRPADAT